MLCAAKPSATQRLVVSLCEDVATPLSVLCMYDLTHRWLETETVIQMDMGGKNYGRMGLLGFETYVARSCRMKALKKVGVGGVTVARGRC